MLQFTIRFSRSYMALNLPLHIPEHLLCQIIEVNCHFERSVQVISEYVVYMYQT